ncbi:TPA: hypothetical protein ACGFEM_002011 [Clostridioides difficile]|uniref:hypothetical protein n=1 Tax=Clostridioides difficile TaxID=1496 RepID=UPI00038D97FE|nr:hypothetical protein [Clostridioides difficile]AXU54372.1 hypothetical protein CDIF29637_02646 [Clostridioides difficile]EGT3735790.1 hypothetical protein [Clostridioides difficile]EGT3788307.1 hypothetical protein [Clostridioides difficile]EGT4734461.1 hypothetical protein [Clostridioides difficile]EGT4842067.1 hypothetical protein [Clostridioides difficile]
MNILASVILVIGSFIAGRVYEYRLNLNENDEIDSKLLLDVFNEISELREENKSLKEKLQEKELLFINRLIDFLHDKKICECCIYDCKIDDIEYDCEDGIKKWLDSEELIFE